MNYFYLILSKSAIEKAKNTKYNKVIIGEITSEV